MSSYIRFKNEEMLLAVILSFMVLNLPLIISDDVLESDKEGLLAFFNALTGPGRLDWNDTDKVNDVCKWKGINCRLEYNQTETRVVEIVAPGVGISGPIVANSIAKLDALKVLNLRSNTLYGTLPLDIFYIQTLEVVVLSNNKFCGDIPPFKNNHPLPPPRLMILDLSFNSFTGNIPSALAALRKLTNLSLENNSFVGRIPNITLKPHRMYNKSLPYLNLSYNMLEGEIPYSMHNFSADSFTGNPRLCGKPLIDCSLLAPAPAPLSVAPIISKVAPFAFVAFLVTLVFFPV